jgi:ABC-2 type transport system permease protein
MAVFVLMLLVSGLNLVLLFAWGTPEWKQLLSSYLGLSLMGGSFIALGLFLSSLTRSQVVAGAATFAIALLLWIVSWFGETGSETVKTLTSFLSVIEHYEDFSKGVIDTKHLAYYLSFIVFGLFLTVRSVDSERWRG